MEEAKRIMQRAGKGKLKHSHCNTKLQKTKDTEELCDLERVEIRVLCGSTFALPLSSASDHCNFRSIIITSPPLAHSVSSRVDEL